MRAQTIDIVLFVLLLLPFFVCEFGLEPFQRGFFCNDESIQYPFLPNTVSTMTLALIVVMLPLLLIIIVEFVSGYGNDEPHSWLQQSSKHTAYFLIGLLLTYDAIDVGKYAIGRLRPHFMAVCQPQLLNGTCSDVANQGRYIQEYSCTASGYSEKLVRQARLSFPSGHSSLSFYAMVYMILYLQHQMRWRGSLLARSTLQFSLLMVAWYTALSRVKDNWHHWSDVLVGSLIGVMSALLTVLYIAKLFKGQLNNVEVL